MENVTQILRNALPHQLANVVAATGEFNGTIDMLIEAIEGCSVSLPQSADVDEAIPASIFVLDEELDGISIGALTKLWCKRLAIQQYQDAFLLSLVKRAITALAINDDLPQDVSSLDMAKLAEIGSRTSQEFHASTGDIYQFNSTTGCWECGDMHFDMDSDGYPCDQHGNHVSGKFL
ncbi:TPA: hypothetical protein ACGFXZ_001287 [Vibrio cholerae]